MREEALDNNEPQSTDNERTEFISIKNHCKTIKRTSNWQMYLRRRGRVVLAPIRRDVDAKWAKGKIECFTKHHGLRRSLTKTTFSSFYF